LIAALQKASAHIGKDVAEDLIADLSSGSRSLLEGIAGDLAQVQHRIVLFLDDLHLVEAPEVRGILDWLINYAPRLLQYVIGTRRDPGLRLSGLRVRCQLLELGAEQLQFDAAEAAQFYRSRLGRDLPALDLQTLLTKTEGWPAALELAALVLAGSQEPKAFIQHFAGTDTSVVDYLCDMVLSQMDEQTRDIVFRISMFDRICAPLARAIIDANDAEEALLGLQESAPAEGPEGRGVQESAPAERRRIRVRLAQVENQRIDMRPADAVVVSFSEYDAKNRGFKKRVKTDENRPSDHI
jgi:LuxR family maltose regulon positive regulatory protein